MDTFRVKWVWWEIADDGEMSAKHLVIMAPWDLAKETLCGGVVPMEAWSPETENFGDGRTCDECQRKVPR